VHFFSIFYVLIVLIFCCAKMIYHSIPPLLKVLCYVFYYIIILNFCLWQPHLSVKWSIKPPISTIYAYAYVMWSAHSYCTFQITCQCCFCFTCIFLLFQHLCFNFASFDLFYSVNVYFDLFYSVNVYKNVLFYQFQIEIIVTKAQIKNINVKMLSKCVDDCGNYQFAICFPGWVENNTCLKRRWRYQMG